MLRLLVPLLPALLIAGATPGAILAQTAADSAGIRAAALDYIEGWYHADAARMRNSLHPDLVKRIVEQAPDGASHLDEMTADQLVTMTGNKSAGDGRKDVRILDIFRGTASVRVDADGWIDYMHLARWNGEWKIVNVLWEVRSP